MPSRHVCRVGVQHALNPCGTYGVEVTVPDLKPDLVLCNTPGVEITVSDLNVCEHVVLELLLLICSMLDHTANHMVLKLV
jgi:hypothetical protein